MNKRYNFRAYPTKDQHIYFQQMFGQCRFVYNWALALMDESYQKSKKECEGTNNRPKGMSIYDVSKMLTQLKKQEEYTWLNDGISIAHIAALRNLETAFNNFFRRAKRGEDPGYPKFKNKHKSAKTFSFHQGYRIVGNKILVPKSGWMKFVKHREWMGETKTVTVKQEPSGKYYISIVVDDGIAPAELVEFNDERMVGVDIGVVNTLTLSDGHQIRLNLNFEKLEKKLLKEQRRLSRKVHGKGIVASNNFKKQKVILAKAYDRIAKKREYEINDAVHQLVAYLLENDLCGISVRKYDIKSMVKVKMGKGRRVQKKINKKILGGGMYMLFQKIKQKCGENGLHFIEMDAAEQKTTAKCFNCGSEDVKISLKSRKIECKKCGHIDDIDMNASKNIKAYCSENQAA